MNLDIFREPVCGMTWGWVGERAAWATQEADHSLAELSRISANWVTIAFQALQDTAQSTEIDFRDPSLVSDEQVRSAIRKSKQMGLRVCLKPVVNCRNGTWRGFISFFDQDVPAEPTWGDWFSSYQNFLCHYAQIAQEEGVELFSVGCEMVMADKRADQWRETISKVREHFSGAITYNCDKYQEDRLTWWDAVDVISASGYYPEHSWPAQLDRVENVVLRHKKPFIFLEAGCPARDTAPAKPNDWALPGKTDPAAQARFYKEMLTAFDRDWMSGFMLWDWPAILYPLSQAHENADYCIYGKPAEQVVREKYLEVQGGK